jgi:hypothetical protein
MHILEELSLSLMFAQLRSSLESSRKDVRIYYSKDQIYNCVNVSIEFSTEYSYSGSFGPYGKLPHGNVKYVQSTEGLLHYFA